MATYSHLERILDDGTDRERWLESRRPLLGASDAAKFAKIESADLYVDAKLKPRDWGGNAYTESGHRWEPMMLDYAGIAQNRALFHAPDEVGFGATPDGLTADGRRIAECKAKHNKIVNGPTLGEWRQVSWQFLVIPEAEECEFIWAEIVNGQIRGGEPKSLTITPAHPKVREQTALILPIAHLVLPRLRAALAFEAEMAAAS